jgi:outer membrane receptor for ferrienterochelin and colicins
VLIFAVMLLFAPLTPTPRRPPPVPADIGFADESRTIVVTGARTEQAVGDSAVATQVIRRDAIEASGAENLAELLEEQPGLQVLRSFAGAGGAGVQMQGLDAKYTLILVDGQRATGRINGTIDLSRFSAEDIEQVEIVKGPASALYGSDAIAGVINIITRKTSRAREGEAHASFGSFDTHDLSGRAGLRRGRWGTGLALGWHRTRGFDRDRSDVATTGNAHNNLNLSQWTELRVRPDLKLTATADAQQRDLRGVDASATGAVFDRRNLTRTASLTLGPELTWAAPARLRLTGHLAYFDDRYMLDQRRSDDLDDVQRTRDILGQLSAQYDHLVAGRHMFTAGIEAQFEGLSTPRLEGGRGSRQRLAMFVQDEWRVRAVPRVVVVPGGRFDIDSQFGAYATPRLAVRVDPHPDLTLRASAGLGYRAPSFRELYLSFANPSAGYRVTGNPGLVPETSRGLTVGFLVRAGSFAQLEAHAFANSLRNLITTDTTSSAVGQSLFSYVNIGAARTRGLEAVFGLRVLRHFALDVSYTLSDTLDRARQRPLPGKPLHHGSLRLQFHHRRAGTMAQVRIGVPGRQQYYVDDDGDGVDEVVRLAPYATLDLRVAQDIFRGRMSLFLGVDNLLDAGDALYLPLVPRAFYGGFTVRHRSSP